MPINALGNAVENFDAIRPPDPITAVCTCEVIQHGDKMYILFDDGTMLLI